ncbi:MAG: MarR family winged helix-turn-helix transcriptional regulator [Acidimicrobiales bacterium]
MPPSIALPFDPIDEARRQWIEHGWDGAAGGMAVVTSVMRVQQIYLARIDAVLRPFGLTFARFELLTLLNFTRAGALPMSKAGARLQVHPTSITNAVDRLEAQGFVRRLPHRTDRRTTLVEIRPAGRRVLGKVTAALNENVFATPGVSPADADKVFALLREVRVTEGDFEL